MIVTMMMQLERNNYNDIYTRNHGTLLRGRPIGIHDILHLFDFVHVDREKRVFGKIKSRTVKG